MSENGLKQRYFQKHIVWHVRGIKHWIATALDILRKDRAELDLNLTYALNHDPQFRNEWQKRFIASQGDQNQEEDWEHME